ncbi:hypothetical protein COSO111634_28585 [Corallococcus soli]
MMPCALVPSRSPAKSFCQGRRKPSGSPMPRSRWYDAASSGDTCRLVSLSVVSGSAAMR